VCVRMCVNVCVCVCVFVYFFVCVCVATIAAGTAVGQQLIGPILSTEWVALQCVATHSLSVFLSIVPTNCCPTKKKGPIHCAEWGVLQCVASHTYVAVQ